MNWLLFSGLSCFSRFFFFKQKTAYEMRISDWSSDVCSSDLYRAQCIGHVMRAKIWKDGTSEPAGWMIEEEVTEANQITYGYTGVSVSNFTGVTTVNPEMRYDLFQDRKSTRLNSSH